MVQSHQLDRQVVAPVAEAVGWDALDVRAVDTARLLAADAVQGRQRSPRHGDEPRAAGVPAVPRRHAARPNDDQWLGRDRFVLSAGHTSLSLYTQLYLGGYGLELADLRALRTSGSATPGHPEYRHTRGVEITTGPLGQGFASAVGMAMAGAAASGGLLDPQRAG